MRKVIEFHAHMGDIFLGQNCSFRTGLMRPEDMEDSFAENGRNGFTFSAEGKTAEQLLERMRQGQHRLTLATRENISRTMDIENVSYTVILPVLPYTSFDEYLAASKLDPRIIPFSNPDFSLSTPDMLAKLKQDIANGARGLKVHAVLQDVPLSDPRTHAAIEVFGEADLPVMVHVGVSHYYLPGQTNPCTPENGKIEYFVDLARQFPQYKLIAAHCGNNYPTQLAEMTRGLDNVYTDTTFCSGAKMAEVVKSLGEDKVLLGTDYPFSGIHDALNEVDKAFPEDCPAKEKLCYGNAARMLKL